MAYELNDTLLLFDEGKAMRHCIAAYASMYKTDRNFMFSLRNMVDGKRRSTLHVQLNEVELFTICQHRSFANQEPDQECMEAADTLINLLNDLSAPYRKIGARE